MKNLHKFFNKKDLPWVNLVWEKHYKNGKLPNHTRKGSFWWKDNLKLLNKFKSSTVITVENGQSCIFWTDNWRPISPATSAPELFFFAKNKFLSVNVVLNTDEISELFHLSISNVALAQMQNLEGSIEHLPLSAEKDIWGYIWGSTNFSSSRIYKQLTHHPVAHPAFTWIWTNPCQPKHKVFFWLLLNDRLSTRNILRRRNMFIESYNCVLCNDATEETLEHLFLECRFAQQCWHRLGIIIPNGSTFPGIVEIMRMHLHSKFFMVAIILFCWSIWTERNGKIFNGAQPQVQNSIRTMCKETRLVKLRVKQSLQENFESWVNSLNLG
jgi:hypothetical protein